MSDKCKHASRRMRSIVVDNHPVVITERIARVAKLRDEYYDFAESPSQFIVRLKDHPSNNAHIFTFIEPISQPSSHFGYHTEYDSAAVLRITTYDEWWKKQINDKTRNMIRKAGKLGIEIKPAEFNDNLVEGIRRIYNETPVRQGRRFRHFGKTFEQIKQDHATFLNRSDFFGAYYRGELVGFIKLVHSEGVSNLMQIISMVAYRDKAPTNALIAKAVERCASRGTPLLHYGTWSRRSMGDFKKHHAFERISVPRHYVPLTVVGSVFLQCGLHRTLVDRIPEEWLDRLSHLRTRWNLLRFHHGKSSGAVAQLAERHS